VGRLEGGPKGVAKTHTMLLVLFIMRTGTHKNGLGREKQPRKGWEKGASGRPLAKIGNGEDERSQKEPKSAVRAGAQRSERGSEKTVRREDSRMRGRRVSG